MLGKECGITHDIYEKQWMEYQQRGAKRLMF